MLVFRGVLGSVLVALALAGVSLSGWAAELTPPQLVKAAESDETGRRSGDLARALREEILRHDLGPEKKVVEEAPAAVKAKPEGEPKPEIAKKSEDKAVLPQQEAEKAAAKKEADGEAEAGRTEKTPAEESQKTEKKPQDLPPLNAVAPQLFPILAAGNADGVQLLPVYSNLALGRVQAGVTRAVIVLPDVTRDASGIFRAMLSLAGPAAAPDPQARDRVVILAPQFLAAGDVARFADRLPNKGKEVARWAMNGWATGEGSEALSGTRPVSSFTALDLMLIYLGDKHFFPDLQQVVIAGQGLGGDMTQRYAIAGKAPDRLRDWKIDVRFLVAEASSYLYLTVVRPKDKGAGFVKYENETCPGFNAYPYGLETPNDYVRAQGGNLVKQRYPARRVTYLVAEKDDEAGQAALDQNCGAQAQGEDRRKRGENYFAYLQASFGPNLAHQQEFRLVPRAKDGAASLLGSECAVALIFGDGVCTPPSAIRGREMTAPE